MLARHPDVLVVEDDHAEAVGGGSVVGVATPVSPAWAVVRSVSKTLGLDLRLAIVCGDPGDGGSGRGGGWRSGPDG